MFHAGLVTGIWLSVAFAAAGGGSAQEPGADDAEFFEKRVRPVLADRCWECHSADQAEGELRLDARAAVVRGGTRGPAVSLERPEASLLVLAINHADQLHMPPKAKLPQREIDDLTQWVRRGLPWPGAAVPTAVTAPVVEREISAEDRDFWAFRPVRCPPLPPVRDIAWVQSPVDYFVLRGLEQAGLRPAPPADRRKLIRRATLDLLGLPPTPDEVAAFLADSSPDAFEHVIDRLLASPRYGERWGRHWLDVARYADSNGLDENLAFAHAYRYRDYVIDAFNRDLPYDEFLREQLAGDLLDPVADADVQLRRVVATGFLTLGAKMLAEDDPAKLEMDIVDEQIDTLGKAVLGLTLGCARCHDHKFDPISLGDYYGLAGIFKSTRTMENFQVVARWHERPLATASALAQRDAAQREVSAVQSDIERLMQQETERLLNAARQQLASYLVAAGREELLDRLRTRVKPVAERGDGLTAAAGQLIEAEAYDRGNVRKDTTQYGAGIGVLVNRGETPNFVEYDVEIRAAGYYQLDLRYAAATARPCTLFVDGRPVRADLAGQTTGSWTPESQTWFVEAFIRFTAGSHVLRLEHPQFFPHIDKLLLSPAPAAIETLDTRGLAATAPPSGYEPIPELVARWREALVKPGADADALFGPWRHFVDHGSWDQWVTGESPVSAAVLAEPRPSTIGELAARYEQLLAAGHRRADESADGVALNVGTRLRAVVDDANGPFVLKPAPEGAFSEATRGQLAQLRSQKAALEQRVPVFPEAMAVSEGQPQNVRIHLRGNHLTLGTEVPRRFPRVLAGDTDPAIPPQASGRRELAAWLTRPDHPLTSRVLVNRVWQQHFGEGLVPSPDNFGRLGETPTHPELLDWLAARFTASGWSIKQLHRLLLTSAAWQQNGAWNPPAAAADPSNRLGWRMRRRRLDAESLRDSLLAIGGGLELTMGGSLLPTANRQYVTSTANVNPAMYDSRRRTVYLPIVRSAVYDYLQAYDFGDPSVMQGKRDRTTVAPQALFLMNSQLVAEQARELALQLLEPGCDEAERIRRAFETLFTRPASAAEIEWAGNFLNEYGRRLRDEGTAAGDVEPRAWQALCRALMLTNEFLYVD